MTTLASKWDVLRAEDLSVEQIEHLFSCADQYGGSDSGGGGEKRYRSDEAQGHTLACLFYEPSTRTRLSFETAMIRLGGGVIGATEVGSMSAAKGESVIDTARVVENFADVIVLRHPCDGAAEAVAREVSIPVINAGDGEHEHPTQTLCDLYTIRQEKGRLENLTILAIGDLAHSRTVHSLLSVLKRYNCVIVTLPGCDLDLPAYVKRRIRDAGYRIFGNRSMKMADGTNARVTVYWPDCRSVELANGDESSINEQVDEALLSIDVCYVTRLQAERFKNDPVIENYPKINQKWLSSPQFVTACILHPLPRLDELSSDVDKDPRAAYFKEIRLSILVRMAILTVALGKNVEPDEWRSRVIDDLSGDNRYPASDIYCPNEDCITNHPRDGRSIERSFRILKNGKIELQCEFCEAEVEPVSIEDLRTGDKKEPGEYRDIPSKERRFIVEGGRSDLFQQQEDQLAS